MLPTDVHLESVAGGADSPTVRAGCSSAIYVFAFNVVRHSLLAPGSIVTSLTQPQTGKVLIHHFFYLVVQQIWQQI